MITAMEIKTALAAMLKKQYGYKVYGMEIREGYKRPSFFVDVRPLSELDVNANYTQKSFYIAITYFQDKLSEADNLRTVQELAQMLRPEDARNPKRLQRLKVGERYLPITDFSASYIGTEKSTLQVEFETEFQELRIQPDTAPYMQEVAIRQELKKQEG